MIKKILCFALLNLLMALNAQNLYNAGFTIGSTDLIRNNKANNSYNYTNQEISAFVGKDFAWQANNNQLWNKYYIAQINATVGQYTLSSKVKQESTFSSQINTGIRFERKINNQINFETSILLSGGYHSGLTSRLSSGVYFREGIIVGINKQWKQGFSNQLGLGFQHASNANLYELNRGFEILFLKLGFIWPQKN